MYSEGIKLENNPETRSVLVTGVTSKVHTCITIGKKSITNHAELLTSYNLLVQVCLHLHNSLRVALCTLMVIALLNWKIGCNVTTSSALQKNYQFF